MNNYWDSFECEDYYMLNEEEDWYYYNTFNLENQKDYQNL